tara:strand:+ start:3929 stop:4636 length:708 start_codon:yes stop_codon:yes gene_type:complete
MKDQLQAAMQEIGKLNESGVVTRGNKKYTTVAVRVEVFRKYFPDYSINTRVTVDDGKRVIVIAEVFAPGSDRPISTGIAEEIRGSSNVNKTSAVENGETSAIGRALANLGLHGGEFASDFEIEVAALKDATMDMNEAIEQAREEQEQEAMEDLQQASDSFPEEVEAEKTPGKNDDIFQKFVDRMVADFKFSKSIGQMNAIFAKEQANYKRLKAEAPAMAQIIEDKYDEMENKLRK